MSGQVDGLGSAPVSGAELLLLAAAEVAMASARSKREYALQRVKDAEEALHEFRTLAYVEHNNILSLRKKHAALSKELSTIYQEYASLSKYVTKIEEQYRLAESKLGKGVEVLQVHIDEMGTAGNSAQGIEPSGLHAFVEEQRQTVLDSSLSLQEDIRVIGETLGTEENAETFLGMEKMIVDKLVEVRKVQDYLFALESSMKSMGVDLANEGSLALSTALNVLKEEQSLTQNVRIKNVEYQKEKALLQHLKYENPARYQTELLNLPPEMIVVEEERVGLDSKDLQHFAEHSLREAMRQRDWDLGEEGLVVDAQQKMQEALAAVNLAKSRIDAALAHVNPYVGGLGISDSSDKALNLYLDGLWKEDVAFDVFVMKEDGQGLLVDATGGYTAKVAQEHQDYISQGTYVELVNILHSMEDIVKNAGKNESFFSKEQRDEFWGVSRTETHRITDPTTGTAQVVKTRVLLEDEERAQVKEANLNEWEKDKTLKDRTILAENLDNRSFLKTVQALSGHAKQLRSLAQVSSLSAGLRKQADWTANLSNVFLQALDRYQKSKIAGGEPEIVVTRANGQEELTTSSLEALRQAFSDWQKMGGLEHFYHLKTIIDQNGHAGTIIRPSTSDLVYFDYASTGEATLNRQIGALGEKMERLNDYLKYLNTIDSIMSRSSHDVDYRGVMIRPNSAGDWTFEESDSEELKIAFNGLYNLFTVEGQVLKEEQNLAEGESKIESYGKVGQLTPGQRQQVGEILARVEARLKHNENPLQWKKKEPSKDEENISDPSRETVQAQADNPNLESVTDYTFTIKKTAEQNQLKAALSKYGVTDRTDTRAGQLQANKVKSKDDFILDLLGNNGIDHTKLYHLFNDEEFLGAVSKAITHGQSVNDSSKQELKKVMFIYQEFIKSAGGILDKISEIIKKLAQHVER